MCVRCILCAGLYQDWECSKTNLNYYKPRRDLRGIFIPEERFMKQVQFKKILTILILTGFMVINLCAETDTYYPVIYNICITDVSPKCDFSSKPFRGNIGYRAGVKYSDISVGDQWITQYGTSIKMNEGEFKFVISTKYDDSMFLMGKSLFVVKFESNSGTPIEIEWDEIQITIDGNSVPMIQTGNANKLVAPHSSLSQSYSFPNIQNYMFGLFNVRDVDDKLLADEKTMDKLRRNVGRIFYIFVPVIMNNEKKYYNFTCKINDYELLKKFPEM
jgi:hypothetical protein